MTCCVRAGGAARAAASAMANMTARQAAVVFLMFELSPAAGGGSRRQGAVVKAETRSSQRLPVEGAHVVRGPGVLARVSEHLVAGPIGPVREAILRKAG